MKTDVSKDQEVVEVVRDRQSRFFTNGVTLSFMHWLSAHLQVHIAVVHDLGIQALHEKLSKRKFPDLPPIGVGDLDLDALIKKTDSQG